MKIFYLDDKEDGKTMLDEIRAKGHIIHWANCIQDACWFLEWEPGALSYDFLIFDLALPGGEVVQPNGNTVYYGNKRVSVVVEYLEAKMDELQPLIEMGKVGLLTGYAFELYPEARNHLENLCGGKIMFFDRASDDCTRNLYKWIGLD